VYDSSLLINKLDKQAGQWLALAGGERSQGSVSAFRDRVKAGRGGVLRRVELGGDDSIAGGDPLQQVSERAGLAGSGGFVQGILDLFFGKAHAAGRVWVPNRGRPCKARSPHALNGY
jgi:hypothetical protein